MPSGVDQSWIGEEARNLRGASDLCSGSGEALGLHRAGAPSHTLRSVERRERDAGLPGDPFGGLLERSGVDRDGTRGPFQEESFGALGGSGQGGPGVAHARLSVREFCGRASAQARGSRRSQILRDWRTAPTGARKGAFKRPRWRTSVWQSWRSAKGDTSTSFTLRGGGDREERGRRWRHVASCVLQRFEGPPLPVSLPLTRGESQEPVGASFKTAVRS
jgi:hypothetical protein